MNIADFSKKHGVSALVRRHFGYRKPVSDGELGGYPVRGALTYMRVLERGRLGLTFVEARKAFDQGGQLVALGVVPELIISGDDQRNFDGGNATAEGIKAAGGQDVRVWTSPAVTYPHYAGFERVKEALEKHGDLAVHHALRGGLYLWTEPVACLEARLLAAVLGYYEDERTTAIHPILFDLNFEQITLLYFRLVAGIEFRDIPCDKGAWQPKMGGGIIISADRKIAREFLPDLSIVE